MKPLLLLPHLGLGDMLLINGMVRELAKKRPLVTVACKPHNMGTCTVMWRDLVEQGVIKLIRAQDYQIDMITWSAQENGHDVLSLGLHRDPPTINLPIKPGWDQQFYVDANVPFRFRWEGFRLPELKWGQCEPPEGPYIFVHQDQERGFFVRPESTGGKFILFAEKRPSIFDWVNVIQHADELHFIESCFAILADSLVPIKKQKLFIHAYARKSVPPVYKRDWKILT